MVLIPKSKISYLLVPSSSDDCVYCKTVLGTVRDGFSHTVLRYTLLPRQWVKQMVVVPGCRNSESGLEVCCFDDCQFSIRWRKELTPSWGKIQGIQVKRQRLAKWKVRDTDVLHRRYRQRQGRGPCTIFSGNPKQLSLPKRHLWPAVSEGYFRVGR
jgi:hypothetical protein